MGSPKQPYCVGVVARSEGRAVALSNKRAYGFVDTTIMYNRGKTPQWNLANRTLGFTWEEPDPSKWNYIRIEAGDICLIDGEYFYTYGPLIEADQDFYKIAHVRPKSIT